MNQHLIALEQMITSTESFSGEQKKLALDLIKRADKDLTISDFKLDRTEKVKRTTAILLQETIDELELKRKAVEESHVA